MINNIGDPELWARFGLGGLVIMTLFIILIGVVIFAIKRFDRIDSRSTEAAMELAKMHRDERREWLESNHLHMDKLDHALNRVADGIRDTRD